MPYYRGSVHYLDTLALLTKTEAENWSNKKDREERKGKEKKKKKQHKKKKLNGPLRVY